MQIVSDVTLLLTLICILKVHVAQSVTYVPNIIGFYQQFYEAFIMVNLFSVKLLHGYHLYDLRTCCLC